MTQVSTAESDHAASRPVALKTEDVSHGKSMAGSCTMRSCLQMSTDTGSFPDSSSDTSSTMWLGKSSDGNIPWEKIPFGCQLELFQARAHCAADVYMSSRFLEFASLYDTPSNIDGKTLKLLLRVLKFLHRCDYSAVDICSILAHASIYFEEFYEVYGTQMEADEVGNILATHIFMAHCYVQDETCPIHLWHKHIFRNYCALNKLNAAVMKLLQIRGHLLRLDGEALDKRFNALLQAAQLPQSVRSAPVETANTEAVLSADAPSSKAGWT